MEPVEEHTGKSAEKQPGEKLDQAMEDLNIDEQEMTAAERDQIEQADAQ